MFQQVGFNLSYNNKKKRNCNIKGNFYIPSKFEKISYLSCWFAFFSIRFLYDNDPLTSFEAHTRGERKHHSTL